MRLTRPFAAIAALASALVGALVLTGPAQAAGPAYVALGDSYSAGNGAGNYISSSGDCHRSNSAYPALWASAHSPSSFTFAACSGAVTSDVTGSQLGGLSASTGLVTITIGGNDAGFSDVITTCVTGSDSTCVSRVNTAEAFVRSTLPGRLDTVYNAIHAKAPNAHVVVLGYPDIYTLNVFCIGLSATKHQKIDEAADVLDTTTASVAAAHGFAFGDVRSTFKGHELCSGDDYLHSLVISPSWESYHPTATGHSAGYLPVLNAKN
ncbi:SGNH/GDSL hydrolase family protein [Actinacidiphila paucisporea]|uniref:GDSL-like Lipase/Acylhydrolase family protein n=1 Tax=Actinacidiphila paucisporea TaxID=310782 RepID=A0A1M6TMH3_9ACTN|nr:SGNH/GDSL hydrolase family protein [Actinacidiphila paucisporea]SHK58185.1 GDSL-like Lipase/Acylhydrolase family protein [Actinacidiphila paucisporea]